MSPPRKRVQNAAVDRWLPVRMDCARSTWDALSAGAIPKARPVTSASPATVAAICQSMEACAKPGVEAGSNDLNMESAPVPIRIPRSPPASASKMLSVSNWRTMRRRPAPKATRKAISLRRVVARDSKQAGDIGAGDQQHQAHGTEQDNQLAANVAGQIALQRDGGRIAIPVARHGIGERFAELGDDRLDLAVRLGYGGSRA